MKKFEIIPGVIIFFHFRNGVVSHLTWNTEANGTKLSWHENEGRFSSHEILITGLLLKNEQDCLNFMVILAEMHRGNGCTIIVQKVPITARNPEEDNHGIIALQFT